MNNGDVGRARVVAMAMLVGIDSFATPCWDFPIWQAMSEPLVSSGILEYQRLPKKFVLRTPVNTPSFVIHHRFSCGDEQQKEDNFDWLKKAGKLRAFNQSRED